MEKVILKRQSQKETSVSSNLGTKHFRMQDFHIASFHHHQGARGMAAVAKKVSGSHGAVDSTPAFSKNLTQITL